MKHSTKLIALSLAAALAATISVSAMAQKTISFDQAVAAMQADVAKNCGKGYNKMKFVLLTITGATPYSEDGLHSVMLLDDDAFSARDPDILGFLKPQATSAQMKSLIGQKKCVPL